MADAVKIRVKVNGTSKGVKTIPADVTVKDYVVKLAQENHTTNYNVYFNGAALKTSIGAKKAATEFKMPRMGEIAELEIIAKDTRA